MNIGGQTVLTSYILTATALYPSLDSSAEDHSDNPPAGNSKRGVKKETASSRRKSTANGQAREEPTDAQAKALKRKNQNRAAQKAFRERREQRVKDVSLAAVAQFCRVQADSPS